MCTANVNMQGISKVPVFSHNGSYLWRLQLKLDLTPILIDHHQLCISLTLKTTITLYKYKLAANYKLLLNPIWMSNHQTIYKMPS